MINLFDFRQGKKSFVTIGVFATEFCSRYNGTFMRRGTQLPDPAEGLYVMPEGSGYVFVTVRDGIRREQFVGSSLVYGPNPFARSIAKRLGLPKI